MRMCKAIVTSLNLSPPRLIIAAADYGQGSSRDGSAKGVHLAGVGATVADGIERFHRTNLIGTGGLPLR
ncbi:hypothetical protein PL75_11065, partial [Neisseria arctica]